MVSKAKKDGRDYQGTCNRIPFDITAELVWIVFRHDNHGNTEVEREVDELYNTYFKVCC